VCVDDRNHVQQRGSRNRPTRMRLRKNLAATRDKGNPRSTTLLQFIFLYYQVCIGGDVSMENLSSHGIKEPGHGSISVLVLFLWSVPGGVDFK
jgi:hypothetical protein